MQAVESALVDGARLMFHRQLGRLKVNIIVADVIELNLYLTDGYQVRGYRAGQAMVILESMARATDQQVWEALEPALVG